VWAIVDTSSFAPGVVWAGIFHNDVTNVSAFSVIFYSTWNASQPLPVRLFAVQGAGSGRSPSDYREIALPAGSWAVIGGKVHQYNGDVLALTVTQDPTRLGCSLGDWLQLPAACKKNDLLVSVDFGRSWTSVLANSGLGGIVAMDWSPLVASADDISIVITAYANETDRERGWYFNDYWGECLQGVG